MTAVADKVAAGNVDDIALAPNVRAVEGAIAADEPGDRAALEKLHAILTPAQRAELVARIESRESLRPANGRRGGRRRGSGAAAGHVGGMMWGRALNLTDAQRQQIQVNLKSNGPAVDKSEWKEARETRQHVLEAFKGDRFVMSEVAPPRDPRLIEENAERMVRLAKASAPVLTPEQRATAAAKLRQMAARGEK